MMQLSADGRWAQWCQWFEFAHNDVQLMAHDRHVWMNIKAMLEASPKLDESGIVTGWLVRSVARNQAVSIRRQTDTRGRCPTLASILKEMLAYPEIASLERFSGVIQDQELALRAWRRFSPEGLERIDCAQVAEDAHSLKEARDRVASWVDKRIAHFDLTYDARAMSITMDDIWQGVELLCALTQRYYPLFHPTEYLAQVTPDPPPGWLRPFDQPWRGARFQEIDANELH